MVWAAADGEQQDVGAGPVRGPAHGRPRARQRCALPNALHVLIFPCARLARLVTLCSLAAVPSLSTLTNLATELDRISFQILFTQGFSMTSSMSRVGLTLTQASWYPTSPERLRFHIQAPVRLLGRGSSSSSRLLKACGRGFWTAWTAASTDVSRSLQPRRGRGAAGGAAADESKTSAAKRPTGSQAQCGSQRSGTVGCSSIW